MVIFGLVYSRLNVKGGQSIVLFDKYWDLDDGSIEIVV
jgi:hypothetical protein